MCALNRLVIVELMRILLSCAASAGVRWGFLEGAVGGSVQSWSVGGQHVSPRVLGGSLRLWLHVDLGGHLALVLLGGAGGGASVGDHLRSSRWLEVVGVLTGKK